MSEKDSETTMDGTDTLVNLAHLDHLGQEIDHKGDTIRIVHIYAEAPDYHPVPDPIEGAACVDDAARAAVVYLRHFELTGKAESLAHARALLRFILYMQAPNGLFYNFVMSDRLDINRDHFRSRAVQLDWWSGRALWALGMGARVWKGIDPSEARRYVEAINRELPHLESLLQRYPTTQEFRGRTLPTWLVHGTGADATSEMLLGLVEFNRAEPAAGLQTMIGRFAEGIAIMRLGSMNIFPYGLHASNSVMWHKWGNSQTQALAEAGIITSAKLEADQFYARLLIEGFIHSVTFDNLHAVQYFERIAYGTRSMAVGLLRLFEETGDTKYARMAGLTASWFLGNNEVQSPMYEASTGRCYDGITEQGDINKNAGAESTIEALYTLIEVERFPDALRWIYARGELPHRASTEQGDFFYRVFTVVQDGREQRAAMVMNLSQETSDVLVEDELDTFLATVGA